MYDPVEAQKVKEYYDLFLASEPGKYSSLDEFKARYEPVMAFLSKLPVGMMILDVGCGTGMAAERLKKFGKVYGVDISPESIKQAKNRLDDARVCLAEEIAFPSGTFDVVVCTETLEHLLNPAKGIAEFNRLLCDGYLIISTPNPWYWRKLLSKIYCYLIGRKPGTGQIVEHYLSPVKLRKLVQDGGFKIIEHRTVYCRPSFISVISNMAGLYQICIAKKEGN